MGLQTECLTLRLDGPDTRVWGTQRTVPCFFLCSLPASEQATPGLSKTTLRGFIPERPGEHRAASGARTSSGLPAGPSYKVCWLARQSPGNRVHVTSLQAQPRQPAASLHGGRKTLSMEVERRNRYLVQPANLRGRGLPGGRPGEGQAAAPWEGGRRTRPAGSVGAVALSECCKVPEMVTLWSGKRKQLMSMQVNRVFLLGSLQPQRGVSGRELGSRARTALG